MNTTSITGLQGLRYSVAYTSREATGVSILVVVSLISFVSVIGIVLAIALSAFNTRKSTNRFLFVRTHVAAYFISLMLCWLIQSIGSILNAQWLQDMNIQFGSVCVVQAVFKHVADIGITVWTTVIAAHTFCALFLELNMTALAMWIILVCGWLSIGIIVGSGPAFLDTKIRGPFYDVSGYWCWISPSYQIQRITLGYMIMFLGALLIFVLYTLTFFRLRGNLVRNGWSIKFRKVSSDGGPDKYFANDQAKTVAKQMLLYPISYAILLLPIAITRFVAWSGIEVPFEWIIFSDSVYLISGLVNGILFCTTRRILPSDSLRIGNWYLIPGSRPPVPPPEDAVIPERKGHSSVDSAEKGLLKVVTFASDATTIHTSSPPFRKEGKRPPELIISDRDSFGSMYSVREGVHMAALSSHWSPDTPPLRKSGRLSIYWQNMSSLRP